MSEIQYRTGSILRMDLDNLTPHERLVRARQFVGIGQQRMADMLGKSRNTVSSWERGLNVPPITMMALWAMITGRSLDWIMWGSKEHPGTDIQGALILAGVRPEGLEPPTFCLGAKSAWELAS